MMPKDDSFSLDDLATALGPQQNQKPLPPTADGAAFAASLIHQLPGLLPLASKPELAGLYNRVMAEILRRGLEAEIVGDVAEGVSSVSLDGELMALIRLAQQMRYNLTAQLASEQGASNREIQATLKASIDTFKALTSHQEQIMSLERQRVLEQVLLEVLGTMSEEARADFEKTFKARLEEAAKNG